VNPNFWKIVSGVAACELLGAGSKTAWVILNTAREGDLSVPEIDVVRGWQLVVEMRRGSGHCRDAFPPFFH